MHDKTPRREPWGFLFGGYRSTRVPPTLRSTKCCRSVGA